MTIDADIIHGITARSRAGGASGGYQDAGGLPWQTGAGEPERDAFGQPVGSDRKVTQARVKAWLRERNLERLFKPLQKHRFDDFDTLQYLDDAYLREMGVVAGDRVRLLKALADFFPNKAQGYMMQRGSPAGADQGFYNPDARSTGVSDPRSGRFYPPPYNMSSNPTPAPAVHNDLNFAPQQLQLSLSHQQLRDYTGTNPENLFAVTIPAANAENKESAEEKSDAQPLSSQAELPPTTEAALSAPPPAVSKNVQIVLGKDEDEEKKGPYDHGDQPASVSKRPPPASATANKIPRLPGPNRPQLRRSRRYENLDDVEFNMGTEAAERRKEYAKKVIGASIFLEGLLIALRATMWWAQCLVYVPLFIANLYGLQWKKRVDVFSALRGLRLVEKQQAGYLGADVYKTSVAECETLEQGRKLQRGAMLLLSQAVVLTAVWVFGLMIFANVFILADSRKDVTLETVTESLFKDDESFNWFAIAILIILAVFSAFYLLVFVAQFRNEYRNGLIKKARVEELRTKVANLEKLGVRVKEGYTPSVAAAEGGKKDGNISAEQGQAQEAGEAEKYRKAVDVAAAGSARGDGNIKLKPLFDLSRPLDEQSLVGKLDVTVRSSKQNLWDQIGQVGAVVKFLKGGA
ncbi:unnamed protein product [Amoebophrya sp. A120]|nr:unnamed protein product [Amoebophrya sp. A120]|eukprot:GSA120T00002126001.1